MKKIFFLFFFLIFSSNVNSEERKMLLKLEYGDVEIKLFPDVAPKHVERFTALAKNKKYDGVVFHRVINGFMAQTGDIKFGNSKNFNQSLVGTGGSDLPDLKAEFSSLPHVRGTLSMARSANPNSANSQFFICLDAAPHLDRQYSVFGQVTKGMEFIDKIKKGNDSSGSVKNPDKILSLSEIK